MFLLNIKVLVLYPIDREKKKMDFVFFGNYSSIHNFLGFNNLELEQINCFYEMLGIGNHAHASILAKRDLQVGVNQDDKNYKAYSAEVLTLRFVIALFLVSCVVCGYLILTHMGRDDIIIPHHPKHRDTIVAAIESNGMEATYRDHAKLSELLKNLPKVHHERTIEEAMKMFGKISDSSKGNAVATSVRSADTSSLQSKTTNKNGNKQKEQGSTETSTKDKTNNNNAKSADSGDRRMGRQKVTWAGCLYELPNPHPTPEQQMSLDSKENRKIKNSKGFDYNRKHIVPPPAGDVAIVCCNTTKGVLNIEVHPTWAPNGAARFLDMVRTYIYIAQSIPVRKMSL